MRDCLGDQVPGLRVGFGRGHSNSTLASLHLCLRVGSTTQPGEKADPRQRREPQTKLNTIPWGEHADHPAPPLSLASEQHRPPSPQSQSHLSVGGAGPLQEGEGTGVMLLGEDASSQLWCGMRNGHKRQHWLFPVQYLRPPLLTPTSLPPS